VTKKNRFKTSCDLVVVDLRLDLYEVILARLEQRDRRVVVVNRGRGAVVVPVAAAWRVYEGEHVLRVRALMLAPVARITSVDLGPML
jgi:hypothetical protein